MQEDNQPQQIPKQSDHTVLNDQYYETDTYLTLIPQDNPKWVYSTLNVQQNGNDEDKHEIELDQLDLDESHKYYKEIVESLELFKKWQSWPETLDESKENAWKLVADTVKDDTVLRLYADANKECTKSVMQFPFSTPVIAGIFCNNEHYSGIDDNHLSCKLLRQCDDHSYVAYAECNKPFPFSANRDLLMVRFCYILSNGRFIFGEKSIVDNEVNTEEVADHHDLHFIRGDIVNLWYVQPCGEDNNHSVITQYCSYNPNGAFAQFLLQRVRMERGKYLLKLYEYLREIQKLLHIEGQLFIPPQLFALMEIHDSSAENGERSRSNSNDDNIIDINLAVQSVITDVKGFITQMTTAN